MKTLMRTFFAQIFVVFCVFLNTSSTNATKIQEVVSPAGIKAWLVEESEIPLLSIKISFSGGSSIDQVGLEGTANFVSGMLDEGAGPYDSVAFQTRLEELAISMKFDANLDTFSGSMRTLSSNRQEAFELFRMALTEPRFENEAIIRIRRQIITRLLEDQENPNAIASQIWFSTAFAGHVYGRPIRGSKSSVTSITADTLYEYMKTAFALDRLSIGVVGDISATELAQLLDKTFGSLPLSSFHNDLPDIVPAGGDSIKIEKLEIPQSRVIFGGPGLKRTDPDWYTAYVLNYILGGGGFSSRLNEEVREKRGLAYSVYSYLYPLERSGIFIGSVGTKNESVWEAVTIINDQILLMADNGVTEKELANAKTYLNGSFPLRLTSSTRIAGLLLAIQKHKLGIDYMDRRASLINAVKLTDINRVAKRLLRPKNLFTVVVGEPLGLVKNE